MFQARVLAIHDLSGFGRCSLTVALPVLSAAGIECTALPTAVLSTHTGGFEGYTFRDLTDDLLPMAKHWAQLGLEFDAIYTGYLGSFEQVDVVRQVLALLRSERTLVVVDPVMADVGKLYAGFSKDFPRKMRTLCADADVVVPNLTEAALLLERPYEECPDREVVADILNRLCVELGAPAAVLTGVSLRAGELGAATYDSATGEQSYTGAEKVGGMYHGTGDVFSSALVAALVRGLVLADAVKVAVSFTVGALKRSYEAQTDPRYGVNFEAGLADFAAALR